MKIKVTDGERIIVNWMIADMDPRAGGEGIDIAGARLVLNVRDALKIETLDVQKDTDADRSNKYELSELECRWISDELNKRSDQKKIPAVYAKYVVMLHDELRSALDNADTKAASE